MKRLDDLTQEGVRIAVGTRRHTRNICSNFDAALIGFYPFSCSPTIDLDHFAPLRQRTAAHMSRHITITARMATAQVLNAIRKLKDGARRNYRSLIPC